MNLKYETYCNAISDGGEEEWDFGWERYENSQEWIRADLEMNQRSCYIHVDLLMI